jgi:hypothetical protein
MDSGGRWLPSRRLAVALLVLAVFGAMVTVVLRLHYFGSRVLEVTFSSENGRVYGREMTYLPFRKSGNASGSVIAWDTASSKRLWRHVTPAPPRYVALSLDGTGILILGAVDANHAADFHIRDTATGELRRSFGRNGSYAIVSGFFLPDSRTVVGVYQDGLQIWDLASGKRRAFLPHAGACIESAASHPDGRSILVSISGGYGSTSSTAPSSLQAWRRSDGSVLRTFAKGHGHFLFALSDDGKNLAYFTGNRIVVVEYATGKKITASPVQPRSVQYLRFLRDGETIAVHSYGDTGFALWDMKSDTWRSVGPYDSVRGRGTLSPDGALIGVPGKGNGLHREPLVTLYKMSDGQPHRTLEGVAGW